MKKNLRIVSAAAAALLAVAPVAAATVSTVNAADQAITNATVINTPLTIPATGAALNVKPNISLNTSAYEGVKANISVSFTATVNGTTATSNFTPNASTVELWKAEKNGYTQVQDLQKVTSQTLVLATKLE